MDPELFNFAVSGNEIELRRFTERNPNALVGSTPKGDTALHISSKPGHAKFAIAICDLCPSLLQRQNSKGGTALHIAAKLWDSTLVLELIDFANKEGLKGKMLRMVNKEGNTALHEAARNKNGGSMVRKLLEEDPELVLVNNNAGASALYVAAEEGSPESTRDILEAMKKTSNAYWGGPSEGTPLHAAVIGQNIGNTRVLCEARPEFLREENLHGNYPIHYAVVLGNLKIVETLLEFDKSIAYVRDKDNRCPFLLAASNGHINIMEKLLQLFPDCGETSDYKNQNALHIAVERGDLKVVEHILNSNNLKELINEQNYKGNTPLHLAIFHRHLSISLLLIKEKDANLNVINGDGYTAMDITGHDHGESRKLDKVLHRLPRRVQTSLK